MGGQKDRLQGDLQGIIMGLEWVSLLHCHRCQWVRFKYDERISAAQFVVSNARREETFEQLFRSANGDLVKGTTKNGLGADEKRSDDKNQITLLQIPVS